MLASTGSWRANAIRMKSLHTVTGAAKHPAHNQPVLLSITTLVRRVRQRVKRLIAALHVLEGVPEVIPAKADQSRAFTS